MKKIYNFTPNNIPASRGNFDLQDNAYSSIRGTLTRAKEWARFLLQHHPDSDYVDYMSDGGRKVYRELQSRLTPDTIRTTFIGAYIEAMVFYNTEEGDFFDSSDWMGRKFFMTKGIAEKIHADDMRKMKRDSITFLLLASEKGITFNIEEVQQAAHEFALTRNGHGSGFWDGDWPENGDTLTALCEKFGEYDLFAVGEDDA